MVAPLELVHDVAVTGRAGSWRDGGDDRGPLVLERRRVLRLGVGTPAGDPQAPCLLCATGRRCRRLRLVRQTQGLLSSLRASCSGRGGGSFLLRGAAPAREAIAEEGERDAAKRFPKRVIASASLWGT
jgi:hypothetical protein